MLNHLNVEKSGIFFVTAQKDSFSIRSDKTVHNADRLISAYASFSGTAAGALHVVKSSKMDDFIIPGYSIHVSNNREGFLGIIANDRSKVQHFFSILAKNADEALSAVRSIFYEIFDGKVMVRFAFKDNSVLEAVSDSITFSPVFTDFSVQGSGKADFFKNMFSACALEDRTRQINYFVAFADPVESEISIPLRRSASHKIQAGGIARVIEHLNNAVAGKGSVVIFTSFQKQGSGSTIDTEKNLKDYRELGNMLNTLKNGAIPLDGVWKGVAENSYLVPNLSLDLAKKLNARYHQWAFIYAGPDSAGEFQLWATPDNNAGPDAYVLSNTWNNYAVEGLTEPLAYSQLPGTNKKISFYSGKDDPQEYMKALDELNKFANSSIETTEVSFKDVKRTERIREKNAKLREMVAASTGLWNRLYRVMSLSEDPAIKEEARILLDQYATPAGPRVVGGDVENFLAKYESSIASKHNAFANKAFWISPGGRVIDVKVNHIDTVIKDPDTFGYTAEEIKGIFKEFNEPMGLEGRAREKIMTDLLNKGWIRLRWRPKTYSWIVQVSSLSGSVLDNLQSWASDLLKSDSSYKNTDVMIVPVTSGVTISHSLPDIANDVLYKSTESKINTENKMKKVTSAVELTQIKKMIDAPGNLSPEDIQYITGYAVRLGTEAASEGMKGPEEDKALTELIKTIPASKMATDTIKKAWDSGFNLLKSDSSISKEAESLFIGNVATGIAYADKRKTVNGDYKKIALLPYSTLKLEVYDESSDLLPLVKADAFEILQKKGEQYQTTTSGQMITLGYDLPEVKNKSVGKPTTAASKNVLGKELYTTYLKNGWVSLPDAEKRDSFYAYIKTLGINPNTLVSTSFQGGNDFRVYDDTRVEPGVGGFRPKTTAASTPLRGFVKNLKDKGIANVTWFDDKKLYYVKWPDGSDGLFGKDAVELDVNKITAAVWSREQSSLVKKLDSEFDAFLKEKGIDPNSKEAGDAWISGGFKKRFQTIFKEESIKDPVTAASPLYEINPVKANWKPGYKEPGFLVEYAYNNTFGWLGYKWFKTEDEAKSFAKTITKATKAARRKSMPVDGIINYVIDGVSYEIEYSGEIYSGGDERAPQEKIDIEKPEAISDDQWNAVWEDVLDKVTEAVYSNKRNASAKFSARDIILTDLDSVLKYKKDSDGIYPTNRVASDGSDEYAEDAVVDSLPVKIFYSIPDDAYQSLAESSSESDYVPFATRAEVDLVECDKKGISDADIYALLKKYGSSSVTASVEIAAIDSFKEALLWAEEELLKESFPDVDLNIHTSFSDSAKKKITADVEKFFKENDNDIEEFEKEEGVDDSQVGHSFYLTRQGHGAGFMDFNSEAAGRLEKAAREFGALEVYMGDDGLVYFGGFETMAAKLDQFGKVPSGVKISDTDGILTVYFDGMDRTAVEYADKVFKGVAGGAIEGVYIVNKPKAFFASSAIEFVPAVGDLMTLVVSEGGFDFYVGYDADGTMVYNIVSKGDPAPKGGYYSSDYISDQKRIPNLFTEYEGETTSDPRM